MTKEQTNSWEEENTNYECQCGHLHNEHKESYSINYTAGLCKKCECKNFCMPPLQQESTFNPEKHAEWLKTNGWKVEFAKFFYGEWDKKCALKLAEENYTNGRISQEKEKWLQIIETKREECKKYPLKSTNGSITDKTANDMVDVALLDIINLIQKHYKK